MKVKAATPELVVVDPETGFDPDGFILFSGEHVWAARVAMTRTLKDHFEVDVEMVHADSAYCECKSKKTFKLFFRDLLQMDLVMHQICSSFKEHRRENNEKEKNKCTPPSSVT